jgi:hypothetical protein
MKQWTGHMLEQCLLQGKQQNSSSHKPTIVMLLVVAAHCMLPSVLNFKDWKS